MANFTNYVANRLPGIEQYEDIFNTLAQANKITMDSTGNNERDNLNAAMAVGGALRFFGWNNEGINKNEIMANVARGINIFLERYLDEEEPSPITENTIRNLIADINNYLYNNIPNNDNGAAAAAGGRRRKYRKSRKSKKSRKSRKSRK